ncbi:MAG: hypothetical protein GY754_16680 [bacterium]|nr:hypothetical protein [bacterium]
MSEIDKLIDLVTDEDIGMDAWGDYYSEVASEYVEKICEKGKIDDCFDQIPSLDEEAGNRLIESLISVPQTSLFNRFMEILKDAKGDLVEIIIDGLRDWTLDDEQMQKYKEVTKKFKGHSKLLDIVINDINK